MKQWPSWSGRTVVCIATGPSLTREQVGVAARSDAALLAINDAGLAGREPFSVPSCPDLWYAADMKFWRMYRESAAASPALKVGAERSALSSGLVDLLFDGMGRGAGAHSGLQALQLAMWLGAARVLLLGYDCRPRGEDTNYFGQKPWSTGKHGSPYHLWAPRYRGLSVPSGCRVVNCTPGSAIDAFQRNVIGAELGARAAT